MYLGSRIQLAKCQKHDITVGQHIIHNVTFARNLGVLLDSELTFKKHINKICQTGYFHLRRIKAIRPYLDQSSTITLIHAFFSSHLDYCNSLLDGVSNTNLSKLQHLQNSAARIVTGTTYHDNADSLSILFSLHWLPVKYRILFKISVLVHKCLSGNAPSYRSKQSVRYSPSRTLRSNTANYNKTPQV